MGTDEERGGAADPAIDEVHLARQTGGDLELADEVLGMFAEQCLRHLATIRGPASLRDRLDAAHTLKGAASAVGAHRVAVAAGAAERALGGEEGSTDTALTELAEATQAARAAIARRA